MVHMIELRMLNVVYTIFSNTDMFVYSILSKSQIDSCNYLDSQNKDYNFYKYQQKIHDYKSCDVI